MKSARHQAILDLIEQHPIDRQEDLLAHLREEGFDVTQATVSRDIRELQLVKTATADGRYRYVPASASGKVTHSPSRFEMIFRESVLKVDYAGHMVLVKCFSGMANAACEVFDAKQWDNVVGTLSGDDTFFILMRSEDDAAAICKQLQPPPRVILTTGRSCPMLASLKIENVAVIEKAEVNFTPGFNVLTGETGAGKSILIDSINAILGNRTSRELVRSGAQKACIWATFESIPASVKKQLEKCGYEVTDDLLLYREINAEGKGSCRVNGMPATAAVVRDISSGLLSIHGQHDSQSLTNPALHLGLLDQYAQNRDLFAEYYRRYRELVTVKRQLDALNASESDKQRRIEALTAEIDTIDAAALQPGEEKTLQERKNVITHAQSILAGITAAHLALAGDEDGEQAGAADLLGGAVDGLQNSARLDESLTAMSERLNDLYYSARELATDLADRLDAYGFDAGELDQIETRLDTIYRIKQKFGMEVDELLARREAAAAELETFQSSGQKIAELKAQMQTLYAAAKEAAEKLTQSRLKGFAAMNKEMKAALEFLNMPGIRFALKHTRGPLSSHGQDTVEFLISTNPGEEPKPLAKIASGGELSRIMLAFKSALADRDALPTVIYDEIDTGVSGLAAGRIGQLLHQTARGHQVLCITHTPQVAAFADNQLLIQKNVRKDRTFTEIHTLDMDGRVEVLARMISGDKVSELSLASARELIEKSK